MKYAFILTVSLLFNSALSLSAQDLTIQTGDHEDFTRIVFYTSDQQEWNVVQDDRKVNISFIGLKNNISMSNFFKSISRERISSAIGNGNNVQLILACNCTIKKYPVRSRYRYIDVIDNGVIDFESSSLPDVPISKIVKDNRILVNAVDTKGDEQKKTPEIMVNASAENSGIKRNMEETDLSVEDSGVASVKENLLPGLLEATGNSMSRSLTREILKRQTGFDFSVQLRDPSSIVPNIHTPNLRSIDPNDIDVSLERSFDKVDKFHCSLFENYSLSDWGLSEDFLFDLSRLRAGIFSEFDDIDSGNLYDLARLYIYHSFGLEARQVLGYLKGNHKEVQLLTEISYLVDHEFERDFPMLNSVNHCSGFLNLLSILSSGISPSDKDLADEALLQLNSLPEHLRSQFAPRLSQIFLNSSDTTSAKYALRTSSRINNPQKPQLSVATAALNVQEEKFDEAASLLTETINDNSYYSVRSSIDLVELSVLRFEKVSQNVVDLISAYLVEYRDQEIESELVSAYALSLSSNYRHLESYEQVSDFKNKFNNQKLDEEFFDSLFYYLISDPSDARFLHTILSSQYKVIEYFDNTQLFEVYSRVEDLGFADAIELGEDGRLAAHALTHTKPEISGSVPEALNSITDSSSSNLRSSNSNDESSIQPMNFATVTLQNSRSLRDNIEKN